MFRRITDFGFQRTALQAVGFYLTYLITGIIGIGAIGGVYGTIVGGGFEAGLVIGQILAPVVTLGLAFAVLAAKRQLGNVLLLGVAVLGVVGAYFAGLLLGLVFVAFLTTRQVGGADGYEADGMPAPGAF